jgi:preprotein translocase subunit SecG
MIILLLAFHILVAIALVGVVLMQKSEGGALGSIGGGGMSGFMTGRTTANLLTRATAILFALFVTTSVLLVLLSTRQQEPQSILGHAIPREAVPSLPAPPPAAPAVPGTGVPGAAVPTPAVPSAPAIPAPAAPAVPAPAAPVVPAPGAH